MQNEINLSPLNYFSLSGKLIFYVSASKLPKVHKNFFSSFKDELCKVDYITVCWVRNRENKEKKYSFLTPNYMFEAYWSEDKKNFSISKVSEDKDLLSRKKYIYYQKSVFIIKTNKQTELINFSSTEKKKYTAFGEGDQSWQMDPDFARKLLNSIEDFFDEKKSKIEIGKISQQFERNIIQKISDYNNLEYEVEKEASFSNENFNFDRFEIISSTAKKKIYAFFSISFDPESELFPLGSKVCVETKEKISDEERRTILGSIVDKELVDEGVALKVEFLEQFDNSLLNETGKIYPQPNDTQKRVRDTVIRKIRNHAIESKYMYDFFTNYSTQGYEPQEGWDEFHKELMSKKYPPNESQMEAIKKGIETKDIQLVLGPPGTGKTTVIVSWIEFFIRHGKRVLISSQNNSAVDNVLERVGKNPEARIIRIGNMTKIQENCKQYSVDAQISKTSEAYQKKINDNLTKISQDLSTISGVTNNIDSCIPAYADLDRSYRQLVNYEPALNRESEELIKIFYKAKYFKEQMLLTRDVNTSLCFVIDQLHKKNIFFFLFYLPRIIKLNFKILKNKIRIKIFEKLRNKQVAAYNDKSLSIQSLLLNAEYVSVKNVIKSKLHKFTDNDFNFNLKTPLDCKPEISIEAQRGLCSDAYDDVIKYKYKLIRLQEKLNKIEQSLLDWKDAILSKNSDVVSDLLIKNSNVVGATCVGINTQRRFQNLDFDVSIIDESGQIQIHNAIIPMTRSRKTLMLGDHLQIPPMANDAVVKLCKQSNVKTDLLEKSFFEFMFTKLESIKGKSKVCPNLTRLNEQFRMPGNISDVISEWFYEGNYHARYDMSKWKTIIQGTNSPLIMITTSDVNNREEQGPNESKDKSPGYCNPLEAKLIADIVAKLYKTVPDFNSEMIGVISAYGKQVRLIRSEIRKKLRKEQIKITDAQIFSIAASLDSFQGQERPLIIYSSTRSSRRKPENKARVGFMKELRRLNVAFTRCQKQLVIIGDLDYLTSCKYEELDPETGEPVPNKSEKKYAEFMGKMVAQSKSDKGEFYRYSDFRKTVGL